jgi:heme-degrading monooxygenase HmoA
LILEVAILNVIPGQEDDFLKAFSKAQDIIASMAGYISHQLKDVLSIAANSFCWLNGKK